MQKLSDVIIQVIYKQRTYTMHKLSMDVIPGILYLISFFQFFFFLLIVSQLELFDGMSC